MRPTAATPPVDCGCRQIPALLTHSARTGRMPTTPGSGDNAAKISTSPTPGPGRCTTTSTPGIHRRHLNEPKAASPPPRSLIQHSPPPRGGREKTLVAIGVLRPGRLCDRWRWAFSRSCRLRSAGIRAIEDDVVPADEAGGRLASIEQSLRQGRDQPADRSSERTGDKGGQPATAEDG